MGASLSTTCSSLVSVVDSFCRDSFNWISNCFGGGMSNKETDDDTVIIKSRGLNLLDDEETGLVKSRDFDIGEEKKEDPTLLLGDSWSETTDVVEAYKQGKIRSTVPTEESSSEPLKVTFTNASPDHEVILCWVSPTGELHHYYRIPPNGGSHLGEITKTGDAFVLFQAAPAPEDPSTNSQDDEEEAWEPVCNHDNVLAAYRPRSTLQSDHHIVTVHQTESTVTSGGGFLRGSLKKQKVNQWTIAVCTKEEHEETEKSSKPTVPIIDTRNKFYEKRKYGDWTVYCEPGCWDPSVADATSKGETKEGDLSRHEALQADLKALSERLPKHVLEVLSRDTAVYMNTTHKYAEQIDNPCGCFHPGRDWLEEHKMNPDKCGQVEFYNVSSYADHRRLWGTGGILLHEFCHAYHNKHLPDGYENRDIIECYQAAMDEGLYDNCNYHACYVGSNKKENDSPFGDDNSQSSQYEIKTTKHYACSNPMEYFAELSVAFLADGDNMPQEEYNKWYPHNARQLKEHDPRAYALLQKLWGVDKQQ